MSNISTCSTMKSLASNGWMRGLLYLTVAAITIPELIWTGMYLITVF
ncbi:MAG: hypothetical protein GY814_09160 [Gammaproteobacteria bacterium]|nr:hypothetical protein [Gammaproteobacteria bacterium]